MKKETFKITISLSNKSKEQREILFSNGVKYAFYLIKKVQEKKGISQPV